MNHLRMLGLLLLGSATAALAVDAGGEFCRVRGSDAAGDHGVWLVCDESRLLVTEDQGMSWTARPLPDVARWRAVKFLDARRGFVAGERGTLMATADGGYNWQPVPLPTQENLTAIAWQGESGWITGYGGVIVHTDDGGRTWSLQNSRVSQPLEAVYFLDSSHGWAVGWVGVITRTTNGGHSWEAAAPSKDLIWSLSSVYFRDRDNGWAVGFSGEILHSRDGGATWQQQQSPVDRWLTSVVFDRAGRGWIAADKELLLSEDGGETWRATEPVEDRLFMSWLLRTGDALWVIGRYGVLKRSPDDAEWRQLGSPARLEAAHERWRNWVSRQAPVVRRPS